MIDLFSQLIIWNIFWYLTSMFDYLSQRRPLFWVWSDQHQQCAGARACWGRWWGCRAGWSSRKIQREHIGGWLVLALGVISSKSNEQQLLVIIMITIFNHLVVTDLVEHHQTSSRHLENWSFEMFFKMKLVRDSLIIFKLLRIWIWRIGDLKCFFKMKWVRDWLIIFKILRKVKPGAGKRRTPLLSRRSELFSSYQLIIIWSSFESLSSDPHPHKVMMCMIMTMYFKRVWQDPREAFH